jgi:K+:H+ antiporter
MGLSGRNRTIAVYLTFAVLPVALGVAIAIAWAATGPAEPAVSGTGGEIPGAGRLIFAVAVVSLATVAGGLLARVLRQPLVVGQMIVGLGLGPSLLGRIAPNAEDWLFPAGTTKVLLLLGGLGAVFFVFMVGLDFSWTELRRSGATIAVLGQGTVAIPFLIGAAVAGGLAGLGELPGGHGVAVNLFVALAMSVTALPVLAYILRERGLDQTQVGALGIGSSLVGNTTAWGILVVTLAIARSASTIGALLACAGVVLFALAMWFVARPALAFLDEKVAIGPVQPALALSVLLLAAYATESLGVNAIVGAFLAGLVLPRSVGFRNMNSKIEGLTEWLLLPMFFVSMGLQVHLESLGSVRDILLCLGIVVVAVIGKAGGTLLIARGLRMDWRSSGMLAAMMNCRGITALVVLSVGQSAGLLNQKLFTIFTVMAILTTMMTGPALDLLERIGQRQTLSQP